jgi:two-component system, OmpR family, phosphate regulon sensor histidine kinase PhoR
MGILGVHLVNSTRGQQLDALSSQLEGQARIIAEASLPGFLAQEQATALDALAKSLGTQIDARVTIIALDGAVLGDSEQDPSTMENHAARAEFRDALEHGKGESTRYSTTLGQRMMYVAVPVSHEGQVMGVARVALPLAAIEGLVHRLTASIISAMAITLVIIMLAGWLISRLITRPIRKLTAASKEIASGKLGQRIAITSRDEVGELAKAFNQMSLKLAELVETISADRTGLATILGNMTDGVIMTDIEGFVSLANNAARSYSTSTTQPGRHLSRLCVTTRWMRC